MFNAALERLLGVVRRISHLVAHLAERRATDRYRQDKSRTLRPVELTKSAAISARWRRVHFWTARCAFAQPIGNLRQHAACVQNGSFRRRAEARRVRDPLSEPHAGPPQPRPGSRCAHPAPPRLAASTGLRRPGCFASKRSWLFVSEIAPISTERRGGSVAWRALRPFF